MSTKTIVSALTMAGSARKSAVTMRRTAGMRLIRRNTRKVRRTWHGVHASVRQHTAVVRMACYHAQQCQGWCDCAERLPVCVLVGFLVAGRLRHSSVKGVSAAVYAASMCECS